MAIGISTSSLTIQRHLHNTQASMHTAMERLSSGKRINAVNDDAAGLAISNKLMAVINGDSQAVRNANDAISLAQIAEGALEETTAILQRMRELSVQSGNGTNTSADRTALQSEFYSLKAELNRISTTSTFNGQSLLDGSFTSANFQIGHNSTNTVSLSISGMGSADLNKVVDVAAIATPAMSTLTFGTKAVPGDTTAATVGSATLSYDFVSEDFATAGSETVTEAATAYTTAWNASTDANVMAYTASSNAGVVTFTQDTAATGALATSVINSSASAAVRSVIVAGDTGVVAVTAVPATATLNINSGAWAAGDTLQVTIGDASFTYTAVSGDTVRASALADSFVAAWNLSTDAEVSKFTASNEFAAMTFTQDTASTGPLTITSNVSGGIIAPTATASGLFRGHSHLHALSGVAAVTGVAATATQTFTVAAGANEIVETSVGSASFTYDFGGTAMASVTATAAAFVAAWNLSTDTNVMAYTASHTAGVVTYTQDTVSAGALTVSTVNGASSGVASTAADGRSTIAAGDTGVVAVTAVPAKAMVNIDDMGDAGDTLQVTIGDASFTYTAVSGDTVRASALADSFVAAWNLSTDAEVSKFTASNEFAAMTFTQDTASTGPLTITSNVSGGIIAPTATASGLFRGHSHLHALSGVAAVTGVAATATQTFTVAAGANEIVETSVGSASFTYDFGGTAMASVTATAAAFVAAWNLSTDTNVMAYTASHTAGVVTYTQDTVSAGALTVSTITPGVAGSDATYSSVNTLDISTTSGATSSITSLDLAIEAVSAERAKLGAFQNRLGHTVSNLSSMIANNSTSRSRIQDADFAAEATLLAKDQVLHEAGKAMIALANTSSASVLSLLK